MLLFLFSGHQVMSSSLRPHELQHTRLPCPSLSSWACSNSCPLSQWCHPSYPLLSPSSLPLNLSQHQCLFQWISSLHQVAKVLELQLQHQSFQLIFRVDFLEDWLVWSPCYPMDSQEFLQHNILKSSILWCSALFIVQLSHLYITTGKTTAFTMWTCVGKLISLFFTTLSRFVIAFLPRSKCLLISWLQLPSAVILEPKQIKSVTVSTFSPSIGHEVMRLDAKIFVFFLMWD